MTTDERLAAVEQHLVALDEHLVAIMAEGRSVREELAALVVRIEPAVRGATWVDNVIRHQVTDTRVPPEVPPERRKAPLLCRWLGHSAGPLMGLRTVCTRCQTVYHVGRGL